MKRDIQKTAAKVDGRIAREYDLGILEAAELAEISKTDIYKALMLCFEFGYALGGRAASRGKYREA